VKNQDEKRPRNVMNQTKKVCFLQKSTKVANLSIILTLAVVILVGVQVATPSVCRANSAEPPSILIIVPRAPDDLEICIVENGARARMIDKTIEKHYALYSHALNSVEDYTLRVSTGEITFNIALDRLVKTYNNIFTLDLESRTITPGKSLSRSVRLVGSRVVLTLAIEAIVFLVFGFRERISRIYFVTINLVTQGALNLWLNGFNPSASYPIFALILGEVVVFLVEILAFLVLVKEHSYLRTIMYVLTANTLSLILGGYLITLLPI
jgi:hypothetical protein